MKKKFLISIILIIVLFIEIYTSIYVVNANEDISNLPTFYDLRNDIDIKVENQGQKGWCNVYSYVKMIETYLQKTRGINYNLSEAYVAYSNAPYFGGEDEKLTSPSKINNNAVDVSNIIEKNYLVLEDEFPDRNYAFNTTNKEKFDNATVMVKSFRPIYLNESNEIKQYIINNGAVQISAFGEDSTAYKEWSYTNGNINCKKRKDNLIHGHAVVIIGWDDNYSKNNFKSSNRPKNNGAWLVLNSWGSNWGNNGTAWVSYEDEWFNDTLEKYFVTGIESITLRGELNAVIDYGIVGNGIEVTISADDKIENINGWISESEYTYTKIFTEPFDPYTIELTSKTDGAKTTVTVDIPNENFKYEYLHQKPIQVGKNKINLDIQDILMIVGLTILTLVVLFMIIKCLKNVQDERKQKKNSNDKSKRRESSNLNKIIILILFILILIMILGI